MRTAATKSTAHAPTSAPAYFLKLAALGRAAWPSSKEPYTATIERDGEVRRAVDDLVLQPKANACSWKSYEHLPNVHAMTVAVT